MVFLFFERKKTEIGWVEWWQDLRGDEGGKKMEPGLIGYFSDSSEMNQIKAD